MDFRELRAALETFKSKRSLEKEFSAHSFRAIQSDLRQLINFFENKSWNENTWQAFASHLMTTKAPSTCQRMLSTYRQFFAFLKSENICQACSIWPMPTIRAPRALARTLSFEEITLLLEQESDIALLIEFLYATGLRIQEALHLKWPDVDLDQRWARVAGKGRKVRDVPFHEPLSIRLRTHKKNQPIQTEWIFASKTNPDKPLSDRSVRRSLRNLGLKAGLSKHVHPHLFRHSIATHLLDEGANLRVIQDILGHQSLSTTQKYLSVSKQKLFESFDQFHPRSKSSKIDPL